MYKLKAAIIKDLQILSRDRAGLIAMFVMPVVLAIVITATQNSTFELVNTNKVPLLLCNKDTGAVSKEFTAVLEKAGIFKIQHAQSGETEKQLADHMHKKDALIAVIIPADFSVTLSQKAKAISSKALNNLGLETDSTVTTHDTVPPLTLLYNPVLQASYRQSIQGALRGSLQTVQIKQVLKSIYFSVNETALPASLENEIVNNGLTINESAVSRNGSKTIPTATQHNIPAWTIFAMFFVVVSLGSNLVKEKLTGSFIRLRTLPTNYLLALFSRQLTYLFITVLQAFIIFGIGIWLFPLLGLPKLNLPADIPALFLVTVMCGCCAVSFAVCVGVFAQTQEQANGIGAVSVVLLAAIGGLLVPSFAMPASFVPVMKFSPLHWCLEAYYGLFLEGAAMKNIFGSILPLLAITVLFQLIGVYGLKKKNLI